MRSSSGALADETVLEIVETRAEELLLPVVGFVIFVVAHIATRFAVN